LVTGHRGTLATGRRATSAIDHRRAETSAIDHRAISAIVLLGISAIGRRATATTNASSARGVALAIGRPLAKARPNAAAASAEAVAAGSARRDDHLRAGASSLQAAARWRRPRQHRGRGQRE
jgi:hypothetical protein